MLLWGCWDVVRANPLMSQASQIWREMVSCDPEREVKSPTALWKSDTKWKYRTIRKKHKPQKGDQQKQKREAIAKWGLKTWVSWFGGGKEGTIPSSLALSTFNCFFFWTDVKKKKTRQQTPPPKIAATAANGGGVIVNGGIHLEMRLVNCCRQCIAQGCSDRRRLETLG